MVTIPAELVFDEQDLFAVSCRCQSRGNARKAAACYQHVALFSYGYADFFFNISHLENPPEFSNYIIYRIPVFVKKKLDLLSLWWYTV